MQRSCPFCEIAAGQRKADVVYEDDRVVVFMDINPITRGHTLVIPKDHAPRLADLDEETGCHLFAVTQRTVAAILEADVKAEGVNLHLSDGKAANQEIDHLHLHIIPRYRGDGFGLSVDPSARPSGQDLAQVAADIGGAYAELWGDV